MDRADGRLHHDAGRLDDALRAVRAGYAVALLLALVSLGGLLVDAAYVKETANWRGQALAQDWFDLVVAAPVLALATRFAARGSRRGMLVLGGALLFTVYTLAIYVFAVHLNALFLLYCAGFGAALWTLILVARRLFAEGDVELDRPLPRPWAGGFLITVGAAFTLLWLAQLVPAARTGSLPPELAATGLLTNPIHVLDLTFILPLHVLAGVALWRRRSMGFTLATTVLAFGALMAGSIAFLALQTGGLPVAVVMGIVTVLSLALTVSLLRAATPAGT